MAEEAGSENSRIWVSNLPYSVHWQDLKDFARQAGQVKRADVLTLPDGRSRGCGIVEFETPEEAAHAISVLNNVELNGRQVFVREDREPTGNSAPNATASATTSSVGGSTARAPPDAVVFVSNLPFSTSWQDLKDLARPHGNVVRADIHAQRGRSKGHGTLVFETAAEAQAAIAALNGIEVNGRRIEARVDRGVAGAQRHHAQQRDPFLRGTAGGEPSEFVYATNLPWRTTDEDLVELFQSIAPVARATIQLLPDGRSAGSGVVQFQNSEGSHAAVAQLNGYTYGDLVLQVSFAQYPDGVNPLADPE